MSGGGSPTYPLTAEALQGAANESAQVRADAYRDNFTQRQDQTLYI